jgi:hypothetical protein
MGVALLIHATMGAGEAGLITPRLNSGFGLGRWYNHLWDVWIKTQTVRSGIRVGVVFGGRTWEINILEIYLSNGLYPD